MKFFPTILAYESKHTFTLGDKIKFYHRDKGKKPWKAFSDTNPYYLSLLEFNNKLYLAFQFIQLDDMTNGKWFGRLCPPQPVINRETVKIKSGLWQTNVMIQCDHYFKHYEIAYHVIPQTENVHQP